MANTGVLTSQAQDFPGWYQDVLAKAELADNGPVRGTMVIRPYGYAIWERMQAELDSRIKAAGVANAYFPLLIPESYLQREAVHVEGFSPELAVVTHGGGKQLEEPVVVRPTSETIIHSFFAKWIQSYRDLPMLLNQWCNVVRWEMRPRLFLRTTEFLWQEGHTAHATESDARQFALHVLHEIYEDFMLNVLAIPVLTGSKTESERFPGAITTWTCEAMMRDGKALQMCTSHELGQNFARAFDITYLSRSGTVEHVWQTSWGAATRLVGALVMAHGDDAGLRLPPKLAPVQIVVLLVRDKDGAGETARNLVAELRDKGLRVELDARTDTSFGRRVVDWELKGVPLRIEVGPRDLKARTVVLCRRDTTTKTSVPLGEVSARVDESLAAAQGALLEEATEFLRRRTVEVDGLADAERAAHDGFAVVRASVLEDGGEAKLNEAGVSVRCLQGPEEGLAPSNDGVNNELVAVVGRAY
ncbi:MAG: proline--tRNA ligase [Acidimicrobiales bacterium]|jgi:prolyl-tRNA synthetase